MDWSKYFVGINRQKTSIFMGFGELRSNGLVRFSSKSGDKTFEVVNAVARLMRLKLNKNKNKKKHYFGYDIPRCGKLILVETGYDFEVYKHKENAITRPLQDF